MEEMNTYNKKIENLSKVMEEPTWFLNNRINALEELNKLSFPEIERLDYSSWNLWNIPAVFTKNNKTVIDRQMLTVKQKTDSMVQIVDFQDAFSLKNDLFQNIYEQIKSEQSTDYFSAFVTAFLTKGVLIYVPDNSVDKEVIELNQLLDHSLDEDYNQEILLYAGQNTNVEIIDHYENNTLKEKSVHMHVQILAEEGAKVQYSTLENLNKKTTAFIRRSAVTKKDAVVNWSLGILNHGNVLTDIQVVLDGQGSSSDMKAIALSAEEQIQAVNAQIINKASHTIGNIFQHGVGLDQSTITFNGIGKILRNAKHCDAQQESRVLLLSDEARADTNPILLIDEYEIEAGHAASITRTNKEQLYYLMSRGLSREEAEKLIIRGFLDIVLDRLPKKEVKENLIELIERKLN